MSTDTFRVAVADDVLIVRQGVVRVLESIDCIQVVAAVADGDALQLAVEEHEPHVVLTDVSMPPSHTDEGIRAALTVRKAQPNLGVVILSQYAEPSYLVDLFAEGSTGIGYLLKESVGDAYELERAIRAVAGGGSAVDPKIVDILVSSRQPKHSALDRLTQREAEVLAAMATGLNNAGIASALMLSDRAVGKHINSIFSKLDFGDVDETHRRVKAVLTWLAH